MIGKENESNLIDFSLNTSECELDSKCFGCIGRIFYYNKNTLENIDIKISDSDFPLDNPINELGKTIKEMTSLKTILLGLTLIESEFQ